jgi:hypothetical protein
MVSADILDFPIEVLAVEGMIVGRRRIARRGRFRRETV